MPSIHELLARARTVHVTIAVLAATTMAHAALTTAETRFVPRPQAHPVELSDEDTALAKIAWAYFAKNRLANGLVSSAASFPATTMWDAASQLAGMTAALELGLIERPSFDAWMAQTLTTLASIPLYRNELPNKAYNADKLFPTGYGQVDKRKEIGFSALDLGRLATWLAIVGDRFPNHASACRAVHARWNVGRLVRDGRLMGTELRGDKEGYEQEGRLGYEQYAAYGLAKVGVVAKEAASFAHQRYVVVEGIPVPADSRDTHDSEAHNYVTSEPYVLDGLENGFAALSADFAGRVLLAQVRRGRRTGIPTAWSEDNLDGAPWFVYNSIYVDGTPWATLDSSGHEASSKRGSSLKAAIGWHVLFRTPDTERAYKSMRWIGDPKMGAFAGFYEEGDRPNKALTLNTNGIVLEALLYARVGMPIAEWARRAGRQPVDGAP